MARTLLTRAVKDDPVEFIRAFCINRDGTPFLPHEAQIQLLHGMQTLSVACWGRQTGKSEIMAGYALWLACTHPNYEIYIIAPTVDQSRIIYDIVLFQLHNGALGALTAGKPKEYPFPSARFVNGSGIHGRGANNPQFIRGKPIHRAIIDEGAFVKDGVISKVIEPMFTVTGKQPDAGMTLISSPFGMGDFYEYAEIAKSGAKGGKKAFYHHATSLDNPHADFERLEEIKNRYGEDSLLWQSEYMARFVDGDLAVFPWSDIKYAYENSPYPAIPRAAEDGHRYAQGVDLANVRDYFVASVGDVTQRETCSVVKIDRYQKRGYTFYKNIVRGNFKSYHGAKTLIDATSLGESVAEDLRDIGAEGYKFSSSSKAEVVNELRRMLSEHRFFIPNSREVIDELRFFSYEITPSKHLRMEAKRGHDDIVMSLSLLAHQAVQPSYLAGFGGVDLDFRRGATQTTPLSPAAPLSTYYAHDPIREAFQED